MKKITAIMLGLLFLNSCIPIRIAPNISDYKLAKGKRFKNNLPKKTTFIFEDPKQAGQFYEYVNTKYDLEDYYVDVEVPFKIDGNEYFFSFYEVEILDKTINLLPIMIDAALTASDCGSAGLEEIYESRKGNWYIAIEVFTKTEIDCLHEEAISREVVLPYLRAMKEEYLSTHNYNEVVFKN